jgi:drug/metabolite transporter (DMT)-like permease
MRPNLAVCVGLLLGFAGTALLVSPNLGGADSVDPVAATLLLVGSLCWAAGSLTARGGLPASTVLAAAMELLAGAVLVSLASLLRGEWAQLHWTAISARSVLLLAYLIVFGSVLAFAAHTWLLASSSASRVGTYAFVNPIVAVLLGCLLGGEALTGRTAAACVCVVGRIVIIVYSRRAPPTRAAGETPRRPTGTHVAQLDA